MRSFLLFDTLPRVIIAFALFVIFARIIINLEPVVATLTNSSRNCGRQISGRHFEIEIVHCIGTGTHLLLMLPVCYYLVITVATGSGSRIESNSRLSGTGPKN